MLDAYSMDHRILYIAGKEEALSLVGNSLQGELVSAGH